MSSLTEHIDFVDADNGIGVSVGVRGAEATLDNWEGYLPVENSTAFPSLCGSSVWRTQPERSNGYAGTSEDKRNRIGLSDADNDDDDLTTPHKSQTLAVATATALVNSLEAVVSTANERSTRRHGRRGFRRPASEHYSSPNRSSGGGGGGGAGGTGTGVFRRDASSRLNLFSRATTRSSLLGDSMTEIRTEDLQNEHEPTSALLDYCKRKFLRPYLAILSLVALNPISTDTTFLRSFLSYVQALLVLSLLVFGYILQYYCSYRGDRGFADHNTLPKAIQPPTTTTHPFDYNGTSISQHNLGAVRTIGELVFGHIIPNALHMCGYVSAVIICKLMGQEQLQNLIERVFLISMMPRRLCRVLWTFVVSGLCILGFMFGYVVLSLLTQEEVVQLHWLPPAMSQWKLTTKIALLVTLFMQDFVEVIVLTGYCIECYLLRVHLATLSHKLVMHTIESQDWMREMLEFRKLLDHLNQLVAISVCFFIVLNLAYAFAGFVYLFKDFDFHFSAMKLVIMNSVNVLLWLWLGLLPFYMAASVTRVCQTAKDNGHQIRVRPFVYHNAPTEDLDSALLFASTLDLSAKLFRMPIQSNYLCFAILVVSIVILTLGMSVNLIDIGTF